MQKIGIYNCSLASVLLLFRDRYLNIIITVLVGCNVVFFKFSHYLIFSSGGCLLALCNRV